MNGRLSAEDFRRIQVELGFTNKKMGDALGMSERTVEDMRAGVRVVAPWTHKLLQYITAENGLRF